MNAARGSHWSSFWQQGHMTSLPQGFKENYDGEFLRFWEEQFARLPRGARVLDVCTGNGSIALLAQEYSRRHDLQLQIKAVDAADIDAASVINHNPGLAQHLRAIEFIPNTLLEDLPEATASVDLVTSQFGIEYTDWARSAGNIYRILKQDGCFSLICHALDSKIVTEMELQVADFARLSRVTIFSHGVEFEDSPDFPKKFASQLNEALAEIYEIFQRNRSQLLSAIGSTLENIRKRALQQFDSGWLEFQQFRRGVLVNQAIANDLLAVNLKLKKSPAWYQAFVNAGLELMTSGDIHHHTGDKAGTYYRFRKSPRDARQAPNLTASSRSRAPPSPR
jgi:ubiquinone/menaquinone biosynthesis C-methylase UbiE